MAGGLYSPHPAAAIRLRGWELAVSGAICLKLRVRPTHYHYHYYYYFHLHLLARRYSLRHLHKALTPARNSGPYVTTVTAAKTVTIRDPQDT